MNKRLLIISIITLFVFASCNMFVTNPNPLIGCYKVSDTYGSKAAYYYYVIEDNGYFLLWQSGGSTSSTSVVYQGVWEMNITSFDFFNASGTLKLHVTLLHNSEGTGGLSLSSEEGKNVNPFTFLWTLDESTGVTELILATQDPDLCNLPGTAFSISEQEFERATGIDLTPDEETPEEPGDEESPETPPEEGPGIDEPDEDVDTPEAPGEETPEEPGTEEPDSEPENPGEEVTDPDQQPGEGEGDENQEDDGGDENTDPPETEPSEDTDTEIVA